MSTADGLAAGALPIPPTAVREPGVAPRHELEVQFSPQSTRVHASAGSDPWRGWPALLDDGSIRATPVPGTHMSMMEAPNVEALGRALSREIGRATANRKVLPEEHDSPVDAAEGEAW
jgi:thioesterase domain-containing protein